MGINCEEAGRLISRALDGEIGPGHEKELRDHLRQCPRCRKVEREQKQLARILASSAPAPPKDYGAALDERVRARVVRSAAKEPAAAGASDRVSPAFRIAALAALVLLSAGVLFLSRELMQARVTIARLESEVAERPRRGGKLSLDIALPGRSVVRVQKCIDEQMQAFRNIQDYLGRNTRWMAVDGNQVEIGVSGSPLLKSITGGDSKRAIVLTFQYVKRRADGGTEIRSNPQFIMLPGEEANVRLRPSDLSGNRFFRYRVKASLDTGDRIHAEVSFAPETSAATGSAADIESAVTSKVALEEGVPVLLGASGGSSYRYELYLWAVSSAVSVREGSAAAPAADRL